MLKVKNKIFRVLLLFLIAVLMFIFPISSKLEEEFHRSYEFIKFKEVKNLQSSYFNNSADPIFINALATGIGAHNWSWAASQPWCTFKSGVYVIENLTINGQNSSNCIEIHNSNVNFRIENCTVYNSTLGNPAIPPEYGAGIKLVNITNGVLINNNCSNNNGMGIFVYSATNITISRNFVNNTIGHGILLIYTYNSMISGNNVSDNVAGILLAESNNNTISENTVHHDGWGGIYLMLESKNNTIIGNNLTYNSDGIVVENCINNILAGNNVSYNENGIFLKNAEREII